MNARNFFAELKRRNVYKVAVADAVVGWLLIQIATQVFPFFEIPNWTVRLVILVIIIGFPIALIVAWAFELTPEGIKSAEGADPVTRSRSRAWIYVALIAGALSIGLFFLGRYTAPMRSAGSDIHDKSIALVYTRDSALAKKELERAVTLDPNSSDAHRWHGWYLARVEKDYPRARAEFARARALDPRYPWPIWGESAVALAQGDYEAALGSAQQLMEIEPQWFYDTDPIAHVYVGMQRWQDALQRYQSLPASALAKPNFEMAICYAHLGDSARAREILTQLENLARERYVDKIHLAAIHAALGQKDQAFAALEQAALDRSARISAPRFYSSWLSPLFDDPRFAAFEDKIAHSALALPAESAPTP